MLKHSNEDSVARAVQRSGFKIAFYPSGKFSTTLCNSAVFLVTFECELSCEISANTKSIISLMHCCDLLFFSFQTYFSVKF